MSEDRLSPTCPRDWPSPEPSPPSHDAIAARRAPGLARPCRAALQRFPRAKGRRRLRLPSSRYSARGSCCELSTPRSATRPSKPRASSRLVPSRLSDSSGAAAPPGSSRPGSATPPGGSGPCHLNGRHDTPPKHHRERLRARAPPRRRMWRAGGSRGCRDGGGAAGGERRVGRRVTTGTRPPGWIRAVSKTVLCTRFVFEYGISRHVQDPEASTAVDVHGVHREGKTEGT